MTIDINSLTIGQVKEIAALAASLGGVQTDATPPHPMIGKFCIVRCYRAGVHAGVISEVTPDRVTLVNSRRLWRWWAAKGISLSAVAYNGIKQDKSRIVTNPITLPLERPDVCEFIECTNLARSSIESAADAEQD